MPPEPPAGVTAPVTWSGTLSCGCRLRPTGPIPAVEAARPGQVVLCDHCALPALVVRVTLRLVDRAAIRDLFREAGVDGPTADYLAASAVTR